MADLIDNIMAFEDGSMTNDELRVFFQGIINDGTVNTLQGVYGRTAHRLIEAGICTPAKPKLASRREDIIDALGFGSRYDNEEGTSDGKPMFQVVESTAQGGDLFNLDGTPMLDENDHHLSIGDEVIMPDPIITDDYQHGGFVARITDFFDEDGKRELIVEDQDSDFFYIEAGRVKLAGE